MSLQQHRDARCQSAAAVPLATHVPRMLMQAVCWLTHLALKSGLRDPWVACPAPRVQPRALRRSRASSDDVGRQPQPRQQQQGASASTPTSGGKGGGSHSSQGGQQQSSAAGTGCDKLSSSDVAPLDALRGIDQVFPASRGILLPDGIQISLSSILGAGVCGPVFKGW